MIRKIKYIVGNFSKEKAAENILPTEFVILNMGLTKEEIVIIEGR